MRLIIITIFFVLSACDNHSIHDKFDNVKTVHVDSLFRNTIEKEFAGQIGQTSEFLGGLIPKYPIVKVETTCFGTCDKEWQSEGMFCFCSSYVVNIKGKLKKIADRFELRELYAPIENYQEALSYAIIMTDNYPIFDKSTFKKEFTYFKSNIKTSTVMEFEGGYYVSLFDYKLFGCGEHPYYTVLYLVTKDGQITEVNRDKAFKDKNTDALCVD